MSVVLESLVPLFLLLALGHVLLRVGLVPAEGWVGLERVLYYAAFPALIFTSLARAKLAGGLAGGLVVTLLAAQATVTAIVVLLRPIVIGRLGESRPAFTSLVQGTVRWNALVALAIVGALWGPSGVSLAAFGLAALIPVANLVSVSALAVDGDGREAATSGGLARQLLGQLLRNPLIIAVFSGLAVSLSGLPLPRVAGTALDWLGQASIATGVLVVGAGIDPKAVRPGPLVLLSLVLKLALMPGLMFLYGRLVGLDPLALGVAVICGASPAASAAYVLARRMGGDAPLMARIVATQTVAAVVTLPLAVLLVGGS